MGQQLGSYAIRCSTSWEGVEFCPEDTLFRGRKKLCRSKLAVMGSEVRTTEQSPALTMARAAPPTHHLADSSVEPGRGGLVLSPGTGLFAMARFGATVPPALLRAASSLPRCSSSPAYSSRGG